MRILKKISVVSLAFLSVYLLVPALVRDVSPETCGNWNNRATQQDVISAEKLMRVAQDTRVVLLPSVVRTLTPRQGLSLPGLVMVVHSDSSFDNAHLRWHEMVHQYQYERDGVFTFFKNYAADFHMGLLKGCTLYNAYRGVGYELEAELAADSIYDYTYMYSAILDPVFVRVGRLPDARPANHRGRLKGKPPFTAPFKDQAKR